MVKERILVKYLFRAIFLILIENCLIDFLQKLVFLTFCKKFILKTFLPLVDKFFFDKLTYACIDLLFYQLPYYYSQSKFNLVGLFQIQFILLLFYFIVTLVIIA